MNAVHIVVAMKPVDCSNADNAIERGVSSLNIEGTRIKHDEECKEMKPQNMEKLLARTDRIYGQAVRSQATLELKPGGRWPANIIHDGSHTVVKQFPDTQGGRWNNTDGARHFGHIENKVKPTKHEVSRVDEGEGSAARFFKECKE